MTMPDTDAAAQQQDSQGDAQAGHPAPASPDDEHPPASEAEADQDAEDRDDHQDDQDGGSRSNREKRYRLRLREAERERDELRSTLERTRQSIVDNAVRAAGVDTRLMVAAGHTVDTLVGDDGLIDRGKLTDAIANTAQDFNITPKGRPPQPNPQQGRPGPSPHGKASWSSALKGSHD